MVAAIKNCRRDDSSKETSVDQATVARPRAMFGFDGPLARRIARLLPCDSHGGKAFAEANQPSAA
jgi:hypothetical protein